MALSIGVDVGGTKIAAGVVDEEGAVLERIQRASPANDRASILDTIVDCALELKESHPEAVAVGIGAAGFVSSDRNTMASGTNLDWTGVRIGDVVAERVGLPVVVENDANAAGWAEARFGAGAGKRNVLVVTLGTGVGGAIVIDGRLVRGAAGFAAEIGHINVEPDGRPCGCGQRGCLERYGSGTALGVNGWELARFQPSYAARIIELSGGNPEHISGKAVTAAAREGDPAALECYARLGRALGQGLADLAAVLDPEVIVMTGGMTEAGPILLEPVTAAFRAHLTAHAVGVAHVGPGLPGTAAPGERDLPPGADGETVLRHVSILCHACPVSGIIGTVSASPGSPPAGPSARPRHRSSGSGPCPRCGSRRAPSRPSASWRGWLDAAAGSGRARRR